MKTERCNRGGADSELLEGKSGPGSNRQHDNRMYERNEVKVMGYVTEYKHISERVIDTDGICFTLMAMTHGYGQGFIYE